MLPAFGPVDASNLFNDQRENDLGDAIAERTQREYKVISDDAAGAYLKRVGERLLKQLPASNIRFQFLLLDTGEVNAYSFPGGRIYVTRKLIAAARSEDELAGVIGHEIGHIITHQSALEMSTLFRKILNVTALTDRDSVFRNYHDMMERSMLKPSLFQESDKDEARHQRIADDIGLYTTAKAGYRPGAYAEFWDRIAETKGKTGGWLSDLFGSTRPESKRLRQMIRTAAALPANCMGPAPAETADFKKWQSSIAGYVTHKQAEALEGVVMQKALEPPLRADLRNIHFSPNGKLLLAQDDSSVFVIARDPLKVLFRIDAPEAQNAQFSPDSNHIVLYNDDLRVEAWDVADQRRSSVKELVVPKGCLQKALSPDGKVFSCYTGDYELIVLDVDEGTEIYRKAQFYIPDSVQEFVNWILAIVAETENFQFISMEFSPDAKTFIAAKNGTALALDLTTRKPIKFGGKLGPALRGDFAFISPDRVVGINVGDPARSWVVKFPSGEVLKEIKLGYSKLSGPAKGDYVLMRPVQKFAVGVVDINQNKGVLANRLAAFDIYETTFASQSRGGELALYSEPGKPPIATVALPKSPLSRIRAVAISPDLSYLAVSERNRGAVWDLAGNRRIMHVRGFRGVYVDTDKTMYADFPKNDEMERTVAKFELVRGSSLEGIKLGEERAHQDGPYLVMTKPKKKEKYGENATLEIRDVRTNNVLWSRDFPKEVPDHEINPGLGTMILRWKMTDSAAKQEVKADPALAARVAAMGDKEGDYLLVVVEAKTGKLLGRVPIETGKGSFRIYDMMAAGDTVIVTDSNNRVLVYSLKEGKQLARTFGDSPSISPDGKLLAIENDDGVISILEAATLRKHHELHFAHEIALTDFSTDGKRLFVLTRDQTAYMLDLSQQKDLLAQK